jgi:hypothetical protein
MGTRFISVHIKKTKGKENERKAYFYNLDDIGGDPRDGGR